MTIKRASIVYLVSFLFVFVFAGSVFATIEVSSNGKGTLIITDPNATDPDKLITMVELGKQPIPQIPSGAILEVFDGEFTVTVSGGDTVDITVLDHELSIKDGDSVNVKSGENEGSVTLITGNATLIDPVGEEIPLKQGQSYPIKLTDLDEKSATEALEPAGLPLDTAEPSVDSRSIEASQTT
jgi:hypothetical protein